MLVKYIKINNWIKRGFFMNSLMKKYLLTLLVCCIIANLLLVIKDVTLSLNIILGINLFYFIPVTFGFLIFVLGRIAFGKNPSWSRVFYFIK